MKRNVQSLVSLYKEVRCMSNNKEAKGMGRDNALESVLLIKRLDWTTTAVIFGGLEFTIPVLMVGATLAGAFGLTEIFWIVLFAMIVIQWVGNAIQGHIGAVTGRPSSVIAKNSFGNLQARIIAGGTIFIASLGW